MAEWNRSANSSGGHPGFSHCDENGIRDDPKETHFPVQETGQMDGHTEEDGLPSMQTVNPSEGHQPLTTPYLSANQDRGTDGGCRINQNIPNQMIHLTSNPPILHPPNSFHAQSTSGFSDCAMNFPPGGNLRQLPPANDEFFQGELSTEAEPRASPLNVPTANDLRQVLGSDVFESLKQHCYESHIKAGKSHSEALDFAVNLIFSVQASLMCLMCESRQLTQQGPIHHELACPVRQCRQTLCQTANQQLSKGKSSKKKHSHVLFPRPEQGDETEFFTANFIEREDQRQTLLGEEQHRTQSDEGQQTNYMHMGQRVWGQGLNRAVGVYAVQQERTEGVPRRNATAAASINGLENQANKVPPCAENCVLFPEYANNGDRLSTFGSWPSTSKQNPTALSEAGLFYLGICDTCQCHHCGGVLREWQDNDDPTEEHFRLFPKCAFARKMMAVRLNGQNNTLNKEEAVTVGVTMLSLGQPPLQEPRRLPREIDPKICGVCCTRQIAVTQLYCLHNVCWNCLPIQGQDGKYYCQLCKREVVRTNAYDGNCLPRQ